MGIIGAPVAAAMANGPVGIPRGRLKTLFQTLGSEHPVSMHAYDFTLSQCLMHTHDKSHAFAADWYYVDRRLTKAFSNTSFISFFFRVDHGEIDGDILCGRKAGSRLFPNYRDGRLKE